jgi:hypothetical protein
VKLERIYFAGIDSDLVIYLILFLKINPVSAHSKWHELLLLEIAEDLCQKNIIL